MVHRPAGVAAAAGCGGPAVTLTCAICLYLADAEGTDPERTAAVTVMNGHAVCLGHMNYVDGGDFYQVVKVVVRAAGFASLSQMQLSAADPTVRSRSS